MENDDRVTPAKPTTRIPELLSMPLNENQYVAVAKVVGVSSHIERSDLVPEGDLTIRWRIEAAAAFLAALIGHAKTAALDDPDRPSPQKLVDLFIDITVKRAREIERQGHA
jgi:hypothetical protein